MGWWDQRGWSAERRWTLHGPERDGPQERSGRALDAPPLHVGRETPRQDRLARSRCAPWPARKNSSLLLSRHQQIDATNIAVSSGGATPETLGRPLFEASPDRSASSVRRNSTVIRNRAPQDLPRWVTDSKVGCSDRSLGAIGAFTPRVGPIATALGVKAGRPALGTPDRPWTLAVA